MITGNTSPLQSSKRTLNSHLYAGSSSSSDPGGRLHCGQTGEMEICHLSRQIWFRFRVLRILTHRTPRRSEICKGFRIKINDSSDQCHFSRDHSSIGWDDLWYRHWLDVGFARNYTISIPITKCVPWGVNLGRITSSSTDFRFPLFRFLERREEAFWEDWLVGRPFSSSSSDGSSLTRFSLSSSSFALFSNSNLTLFT